MSVSSGSLRVRIFAAVRGRGRRFPPTHPPSSEEGSRDDFARGIGDGGGDGNNR